MHFKRSFCLALSTLFILSVSVPALSVQGEKAIPAPKTTWQQFISEHPNFQVEYVYPSRNKTNRLVAEAGVPVKLPAGTPVILKLTETVSSESATEGSTITFSVVQDVKVGNAVLIKAGTPGQAQVTAREAAGRVGQSGSITISDFSVKAVDGSYIALRGTLSNQGSDKVVTSGVLSWLICPLFLLMKGGKASVPAGMEKTTYTAGDTEVSVP